MFGGYKLSIVAAFGDVYQLKLKTAWKSRVGDLTGWKTNKPKGGEISSKTYNLNSTTEKNHQLLIHKVKISKRIKPFKNKFDTISDRRKSDFNALKQVLLTTEWKIEHLTFDLFNHPKGWEIKIKDCDTRFMNLLFRFHVLNVCALNVYNFVLWLYWTINIFNKKKLGWDRVFGRHFHRD